MFLFRHFSEINFAHSNENDPLALIAFPQEVLISSKIEKNRYERHINVMPLSALFFFGRKKEDKKASEICNNGPVNEGHQSSL